jgi:nicotinamide mononucleotide transporter
VGGAQQLVELAGAVFGVAYVVLAIRESAWCWPAGLANAGLYLAVFLRARLYGQVALQAVYLLLSCYGWWLWLRGGEQRGPLRVSRTPVRWALALLVAVLAATGGLGLYLDHGTDAALPYPDAATTAASLAAQWMTTRKWLESWLVWIAVDVVYVALYLSQALYPTAALYAFFLVMAALGFREWRAALRRVEAGAGP